MSNRTKLPIAPVAIPRPMRIGRRVLLGWAGAWAGTTAAAGVLPAVACKSGGSAGPAPGFFTDDEKSALSVLADVVLPPDQDPGGSALGAVQYVENLCTSLDGVLGITYGDGVPDASAVRAIDAGTSGTGEPDAGAPVPMVFAGGPFSGRNPEQDGNGGISKTYPSNEFVNFIPLDRVHLTAYRLYLFGSAGVPGGGPNDAVVGPVVGLRDQMKQGLAAALAASPGPIASLTSKQAVTLFDGLDLTFRNTLIELVGEAAFAPPEYGGNVGLAGWKMVHFEGDIQPLGYLLYDDATKTLTERADAPVTSPNPGTDPDPLDSDTLAIFSKVIAFAGGKEFS